MITKSIFKKHIQPLNNNILTSYLLKTTTLWSFENKHFSQDDWLDDKKILATTHGLFKNLKKFLEKGFLPSYFIPELNLIKKMDEKLIKDVINVIDKIVNATFEDLFRIQELKDAQNHLQEFKTFFIYSKIYIEIVEKFSLFQ